MISWGWARMARRGKGGGRMVVFDKREKRGGGVAERALLNSYPPQPLFSSSSLLTRSPFFPARARDKEESQLPFPNLLPHPPPQLLFLSFQQPKNKCKNKHKSSQFFFSINTSSFHFFSSLSRQVKRKQNQIGELSPTSPTLP